MTVIPFTCGCGQAMRFRIDAAGKFTRCPACRDPIQVPTFAPASTANTPPDLTRRGLRRAWLRAVGRRLAPFAATLGLGAVVGAVATGTIVARTRDPLAATKGDELPAKIRAIDLPRAETVIDAEGPARGGHMIVFADKEDFNGYWQALSGKSPETYGLYVPAYLERCGPYAAIPLPVRGTVLARSWFGCKVRIGAGKFRGMIGWTPIADMKERPATDADAP